MLLTRVPFDLGLMVLAAVALAKPPRYRGWVYVGWIACALALTAFQVADGVVVPEAIAVDAISSGFLWGNAGLLLFGAVAIGLGGAHLLSSLGVGLLLWWTWPVHRAAGLSGGAVAVGVGGAIVAIVILIRWLRTGWVLHLMRCTVDRPIVARPGDGSSTNTLGWLFAQAVFWLVAPHLDSRVVVLLLLVMVVVAWRLGGFRRWGWEGWVTGLGLAVGLGCVVWGIMLWEPGGGGGSALGVGVVVPAAVLVAWLLSGLWPFRAWVGATDPSSLLLAGILVTFGIGSAFSLEIRYWQVVIMAGLLLAMADGVVRRDRASLLGAFGLMGAWSGVGGGSGAIGLLTLLMSAILLGRLETTPPSATTSKRNAGLKVMLQLGIAYGVLIVLGMVLQVQVLITVLGAGLLIGGSLAGPVRPDRVATLPT